MDFVSAERLKRERGFAPTGDSKRDGKGGEVIGQVLQRLSSEIVRSFSYFRSLPGGGQVNRVLLTGGGARLKNIVPYLKNQLSMDVRIAQTLPDIKIAESAQALQQQPEQAAVVLGMALRCCDKVAIDINLIPPRILEMARRKEQALYWAFSICALVLIFASLVPAAANENKQVKERIERLKDAIRAYDPMLVQQIQAGSMAPQSELRAQLDARRRQLQALEEQVKALDRARYQRRFWLDEISLINEARPVVGQLWFSSVETTVIADDQQAQQQQQQAPGRMGARSTDEVQRTAGFSGLQMPGSTGAASSGPGRRPGVDAAAGPGQVSQVIPIRRAGDVSVPRANGMIIYGYAESDEVIKQYVDELRIAARQLPTNWYVSAEQVVFSQRSVQRVPWSILYDAPITGGPGAGRGGAVRPGDPALYSFTVEVKFRYTPERPERAGSREGTGT